VTYFIDLREETDKEAALRIAVGAFREFTDSEPRMVDPALFAGIPGSPFVYNMPLALLELAGRGSTLVALGAKARQGFGASTRFHRLWWEVPPVSLGQGLRWWWLAHGTPPAPFYKPTYFVALWDKAGRESKADVAHRYPYLKGNYGFKIQAEDWYGRPGLCYGKRTNEFTAQILPAGHMFSFEGTAIHQSVHTETVWSLLGVLNSSPVRAWLNATCAQHKTYSYVNTLPLPTLLDSRLGELARGGWANRLRVAQAQFVGNQFLLPALLSEEGGTLEEREQAWCEKLARLQQDFRDCMLAIDKTALRLFDIDVAELPSLRSSHEIPSADQDDADAISEEEEEGQEDIGEEATLAHDLYSSLLEWCVGVAFGRFDLRLATGERELPPDPEPFDPLPACSPGMLKNAAELPADAAPPGYPIAIPEDGILVDDPGHPADLARRIEQIFDVLNRERGHAWLTEACEAVGSDVRTWLARSCFEGHLKHHSKGSRKAPVFWQLGTKSRHYSVWLYYPRATQDTLYRILNDYVTPKLRHEEQRLVELTQTAGGNPTARQRKELAAQEDLVDELRSFRADVEGVAPMWKPAMDDGVMLNVAPLWRLLDATRSWQREAKKKWTELGEGKYDWARWAMHLWPERVVPKCATDRSLAIAHGLEEVLWEEDGDGRWTAKDLSSADLQRLIAKRSSPAVQAALQSLMNA
jgi:hypothetical protein